jgi:lysozyme
MLWKGPWIFWQFSDKGKIPGIKGAVDFNVFRGDSIEFYSKLVRD